MYVLIGILLRLTRQIVVDSICDCKHYHFSNEPIHAGEQRILIKLIFISADSVTNKICRIWRDENPHVMQEKPVRSQIVTVWYGFYAGGVIGPDFLENTARNVVTVNIIVRS